MKYLFLDLETTGLDPKKDFILEVACVALDHKFDIIEGFSRVINRSNYQLEKMGDYVHKMHTENNLLNEIPNGDPEHRIIVDIEDFISKYWNEQLATNKQSNYPILAGNSIHFDRSFIKYHWPSIDRMLNYRMFDVSSIKILFENYYGISSGKKNAHRALPDVMESIEELRFYLKHINLPSI